MKHNDHPIDMDSQEYMECPEKVEELESFGLKVTPVDLNKGFVPMNKYDSQNLKETGDNIRHRFSL